MIQILHYCVTSNTSIQWNLPTNPTRLGPGQGREEREEKKREMMMTVVTRMIMASIVIILFLHINTVDK